MDRSGAYKARQIAKEILKSNENYDWCQVQLSYAIGMLKPLAIYIETNCGNVEPSEELYEQCKLKNILNDLNLKHINYEELAKYGHFRD